MAKKVAKSVPAKAASKSAKAPTKPAKSAPAKGGKSSGGGLKMAPSEKFEEAKKASADAWAKSRTRQVSRGLSFIPDGTYVLRVVGAKIDVYKGGNNDGVMYLSLTYAIAFAAPAVDDEGNEIELIGKTITTRDDFSHDEIPGFSTPTTRMDLLSERLQKMGIETAEMEIDDFEELVDSLNNEKPFFKGKVVTKEKAGTGKNAGRTFTNRNVNIYEPLNDEEYNELLEQFGEEGIPGEEQAESEE